LPGSAVESLGGEGVKFCQVLSRYCVAEIRRTEFSKYSERH